MADGTLLDLTTAVHLEGLESGIADAVDMIHTGTGAMSADFEKLTVSTDVSLGTLKGSLDAVQVTVNTMATQTSAALAELKSSFATLSATVAESMGRSTAAVVGGVEEQSTALGALRERLALTSEGFRASAYEAGSSFGFLGAALGVGIGAEYLNSLKEATIELDHLATASGISISELVQWKEAMAESGASAEDLDRILPRLASHMVDAANGNKEAAAMFRVLGVDTEEWHGKLPNLDTILMQIADHLHSSAGGAANLGVAYKELGRGSQELIAFLSQGSAAVQEIMSRYKDLGDEQERAAKSAFELQKQEELVSATLKSAMLPLLVALEPVIKLLAEEFIYLAGLIETTVEQAKLLSMTLGHVAYISFDVMTGNLTAVRNEWKNLVNDIKLGAHDVDEIRAHSMKAVDDVMQPMKEVGSGGIQTNVPNTQGEQSRIDGFKEQLEQMKTDADAFHGLSLEKEQAFWDHILKTQKLSAKERAEVERELNSVLHKLALEHYQDQIALDDEMIRITAAGSAARLAAEQKKRDDVAAGYGEGSKQAIAANMQVLEEQIKADKVMAADVQRTVEQQSESFKAGSQERINIVAAGIAKLKTMQDNVLSGKTVQGGQETAAPVGPNPQADSNERIQLRETEAVDIQKVVEALQAKLAADYRSETSEVMKQTLEQERIKFESIIRSAGLAELTVDASKKSSVELVKDAQSTAELQASSSKRTADEQIKEIDRLAQFDLITFSQKIAMTRQIIDNEARAASAKAATTIDEIQAEQRSTQATLEAEAKKQAAFMTTEQAEAQAAAAIQKSEEAATQKIAALQKQLAQVLEELGQKRMALDDQVTNHEEQNAQKAAAVVSSAFERSFGTLITTHTNFMSVMQKFWNDMVQGWAQMGLKIVAQYVQHLAQILAMDLIHAGQQTAIQQAQTTVQAAGQAAQTGAVAAGQAAQTAAVSAGTAARTGTSLIADLKSIGSAAATAAAHAFKWVMEEVPFPADVVLAPAVAAATFGAVLAFKGLASAEGGFDVPRISGGGSILTQLHSREMVLPGPLAEGMRGVIGAVPNLGSALSVSGLHKGASGAPGVSGGPGGNGGPGGSGGTGSSSSTTHNHFQINLHGGSADELRGMLDSELVPRIQRAVRNGALKQ